MEVDPSVMYGYTNVSKCVEFDVLVVKYGRVIIILSIFVREKSCR
jgi:hypothetical protein